MSGKGRPRSTRRTDSEAATLDFDTIETPPDADNGIEVSEVQPVDPEAATSKAAGKEDDESPAEGVTVSQHDGAVADAADPIPDGTPEDRGDDHGRSASPRWLLNIDRVVGLIVATAVGDALGWPQEDRSNIVGGDSARYVSPRPEFRTWERTAGSQYGRYTDPVFAGEYSDDTQLMLAVARACHHENWYEKLTRVELPFWPVYQRGGGGAVLAASRGWSEGKPPWAPPRAGSRDSRERDRVARYFDAGANGVAMRIAPHAVIRVHDEDETELIRRVIADGVTTHGHPRALVGGVIHALGLRHALRQDGTLEYGELLDYLRVAPAWRDPQHFLAAVPEGWLDSHAELSRGDTHQPPDLLWQRTCQEAETLLTVAMRGLSQGATTNDQRTLTDIGVYDKQRSGAGTVTAVAAAYVAARTASRPMGGLLRTGFLREADTDTLCSMTGALLGATQGTGWLAHLFAEVQDREYLIKIASSLAAIGDSHPPVRSGAMLAKPLTAASNRKWVKDLFEGKPLQQAPDGRPISVQRISPLETGTRQFMARAVVRAADGQTLIVDRTSKTPIPTVALTNELAPNRLAVRNQDETRRSSPTDRRWQPATLAGVELRVSNVPRTALFLHEVFGLPTSARPNERISVGTFVVLAPISNGESTNGAASILDVHSKDLNGIAGRTERFENAAAQWTDEGKCLWIREPGGLRIRVTSG